MEGERIFEQLEIQCAKLSENPHKFEGFSIADTPVTARGPKKCVWRKFKVGQCPPGADVSRDMLDFSENQRF